MPITVKVINKSKNPLPEYATKGSAGLDFRADLEGIKEEFFFGVFYDQKGNLCIPPNGRCLIPTNLYMAIPEGYELQLRPRSGLGLKFGLSMPNTPATIDSDFRGNVGIILINHGKEVFRVNDGDRLCQGVIAKVEQLEWEEVEELDETERGEGGYGHTKLK